MTTETRFARICIATTGKPVLHMNRLKIRTEEMTVIAATVSFIAGAAFGVMIMCACIAAGRADRENNTVNASDKMKENAEEKM